MCARKDIGKSMHDDTIANQMTSFYMMGTLVVEGLNVSRLIEK